MPTAKRTHTRTQSGEWGVVEAWSTQGFGQGAPVWLAFWMELVAEGKVSIEIDPDRDANITSATWRRTRHAFGLPERILVLDEDTARRVRKVVPSRVAVVLAPDHPRLKALAASFNEAPEDELDIVPYPAPRARC